MIYQHVKRYLKKTFGKASEDFNWDTLNNIHFSTYIEGRYTNKDLAKGSSEIKEAFKDFLAPIGKIIFRYSEENGIKIKIFPYRVEPKDSKHLKQIIKIILNNKRYIKYPYQGQNDQIAILGKIRRDVNREVADSDESVNVKELVKYAIRVALGLKEEDIITQLKRKYIVKIFEKNSVLDAKEVEKPVQREGIQNRFNGYTEEQIEETYKEIFVRGSTSVESFLNKAMKDIFSDGLDFRKINNKHYEENALKIIHAGIAKELNNYIEVEFDYVLGVTGYVMRKHFYSIHEFMAIEIIECIYEKDQNANKFLRYYNGRTLLIDNQKYEIPSLETSDGRPWNNSSLIGICNLWMNTKKRKELIEHKLIETDLKLNEIKEKLLCIQPELDTQEKIIAEGSAKYDKVNAKHEQVIAKAKYLENTSKNSDEYFKFMRIVKISTKEVEELQELIKKAKEHLKFIKESNAGTYAELDIYNEQKKQLLSDVKAQNINIDSKSAQIDPIIESIVKVLVSRTRLI